MQDKPSPGSGPKPGFLMGMFGSGGFTIVAATFLGFAAGLWIDGRLGTSPVFMILLLFAGFIIALLNIYFRARQYRRRG